MSTKAIQVSAVTSPDQWTLGAGVSKVAAVTSPTDDDTSYILGSSVNYSEQYRLVGYNFLLGTIINTVSIFSRCRRVASNAGWKVSFMRGGASSVSANHLVGAAYLEYTDALARPGGGSWDPGDFQVGSAIFQIKITSITPNAIRCTSFWVIIDYTPPPSAFFQLFP